MCFNGHSSGLQNNVKEQSLDCVSVRDVIEKSSNKESVKKNVKKNVQQNLFATV